MQRDEIAALAKGMVPFVHECVAEAFAKTAALPPELAAEVASAARLLHEAPALAQRSEAPPRVSRIERDADGNLVPIYEEPTL
jgi:hypothetical protein